MSLPTTRDYVAACIAGGIGGFGSLWLLSVLSNSSVLPLDLAVFLANYLGRDTGALGFFVLDTAAIVLLSLAPAFVMGLVLGLVLYHRSLFPAVLASLVLVMFHASPMLFVTTARSDNLFLLQYLEIVVLTLGVFILSSKIGSSVRLRVRPHENKKGSYNLFEADAQKKRAAQPERWADKGK